MNFFELTNALKSKFGGDIKPLTNQSQDEGGAAFMALQVAANSALKILKHCRDDSELSFDFLECIIAVDLGSSIELIYRIRSVKFGHKLNLSFLLESTSPQINSVSRVWPVAVVYEAEIQELFGVGFKEPAKELRKNFLPEGWEGFPLLKKYEYPKEFEGIVHEPMSDTINKMDKAK